MKFVKHIGYYNDHLDICDLYPCDTIKDDMGDIVVKYMKDGYGHFYYNVDDDEPIPYQDFEDEVKGGEAKLTTDGKYLVTFQCGDWKRLAKGSDDHGFFIDIYEIICDGEEVVTVGDVRKLQETYDKLLVVKEKIDKILMDIAPYVAQ